MSGFAGGGVHLLKVRVNEHLVLIVRVLSLLYSKTVFELSGKLSDIIRGSIVTWFLASSSFGYQTTFCADESWGSVVLCCKMNEQMDPDRPQLM